MKATATGSGEAQTGYDTKRNGAVKVHALAAPPLGNGSDGVFILFSCPGVFLLNRLQGKPLDKSSNIRRTPCRSTRPKFYRLGETSVFTPLPPCALTVGMIAKTCGSRRKVVSVNIEDIVFPLLVMCLPQKRIVRFSPFPSIRPKNQTMPATFFGAPADTEHDCMRL